MFREPTGLLQGCAWAVRMQCEEEEEEEEEAEERINCRQAPATTVAPEAIAAAKLGRSSRLQITIDPATSDVVL